MDHTHILNFSLDDQIIYFKASKGRNPLIEDDLKILKVEYINNHCMNSEGDIKGKQRGNLECGSAQPRLLIHIVVNCYKIFVRISRIICNDCP
jgi:hypothetical protein